MRCDCAGTRRRWSRTWVCRCCLRPRLVALTLQPDLARREQGNSVTGSGGARRRRDGGALCFFCRGLRPVVLALRFEWLFGTIVAGCGRPGTPMWLLPYSAPCGVTILAAAADWEPCLAAALRQVSRSVRVLGVSRSQARRGTTRRRPPSLPRPPLLRHAHARATMHRPRPPSILAPHRPCRVTPPLGRVGGGWLPRPRRPGCRCPALMPPSA